MVTPLRFGSNSRLSRPKFTKMAELAKDQSLGLTYTSHKYGEHSRQKLGVWRFSDRLDQETGYWVVYDAIWNLPLRLCAD